ncbi:hypothetical protein B0T26DRAFT_298297 [Lasiosphaeria miniovina]|uniref:Uncharacterized protein n=1 Tax=Lasiosphaeria miniovina TaxID=1954250 RepID=A0AA40AKL7_9PEZI|nr:uncharacterized protein B0T26DRAFT_298297 [Lasiosphaeria miniovina]KAK0717507.1 hypothetical protein B0T26DRAFT_298297 [Lasiosphaeria miniovina]
MATLGVPAAKHRVLPLAILSCRLPSCLAACHRALPLGLDAMLPRRGGNASPRAAQLAVALCLCLVRPQAAVSGCSVPNAKGVLRQGCLHDGVKLLSSPWGCAIGEKHVRRWGDRGSYGDVMASLQAARYEGCVAWL